MDDGPRSKARGTHLDDGSADEPRLEMGEAAVILQQAQLTAEHEFRPGHRARFLVWGLALLIGYGTMWLQVRGQRPFHGPNSAAFAALTLLAVGAGVATALQTRAESGVGGRSARRQRIHLLGLLIGLAGCSAWRGRWPGPAPAGP